MFFVLRGGLVFRLCLCLYLLQERERPGLGVGTDIRFFCDRRRCNGGEIAELRGRLPCNATVLVCVSLVWRSRRRIWTIISLRICFGIVLRSSLQTRSRSGGIVGVRLSEVLHPVRSALDLVFILESRRNCNLLRLNGEFLLVRCLSGPPFP